MGIINYKSFLRANNLNNGLNSVDKDLFTITRNANIFYMNQGGFVSKNYFTSTVSELSIQKSQLQQAVEKYSNNIFYKFGNSTSSITLEKASATAAKQ